MELDSLRESDAVSGRGQPTSHGSSTFPDAGPRQLQHPDASNAAGCLDVNRSTIRDSFVAQATSGNDDYVSIVVNRATNVPNLRRYPVGQSNASHLVETPRTYSGNIVHCPVNDTVVKCSVDGDVGSVTSGTCRDGAYQPASFRSAVQELAGQDHRLYLQETAKRSKVRAFQPSPISACFDSTTHQSDVIDSLQSGLEHVAFDAKIDRFQTPSGLLQSGKSTSPTGSHLQDQLSSLLNANKYQANLIVQLRSKLKEQEEFIAELTEHGDLRSTMSNIDDSVAALQAQCDTFKEDFENERRAKERALNEKKSLEQQVSMLLNELRVAQQKITSLENASIPNSGLLQNTPAASSENRQRLH